MGTSERNDTKKIPLTKGYGGLENGLLHKILILNDKNIGDQKSGLKS
jgi:hypothetical protein